MEDRERIAKLESRLAQLESIIEDYINQAADKQDQNTAMACVLAEKVYPGRNEEFMADVDNLVMGADMTGAPSKLAH